MINFFKSFISKPPKWRPSRRLSTEKNNAVIFDECRPNIFHGYVAEWGELTDQHRILLYDTGRIKKMNPHNNEIL